MPTAGFQPVIGGGFDQDAAQQMQWAQYNRGVDEANMARAERANSAYSQWLQQVSQTQREDASRAGAQDAQAGREAESARQFDVQTGLSKDQHQIEREKIKAAEAKDKALKDETLKTHENFGKNFVDDAKSASQDFLDANTAHSKALEAMKTEAASWQQQIPGTKYNPRTNELEQANRLVPIAPELLPKMQAANESLGKVQARYLEAKQDLDYKTKTLNTVQQHAYQNGYIIKGSGKDAYIYSPTLNKSFGQMVKEAGGNVLHGTQDPGVSDDERDAPWGAGGDVTKFIPQESTMAAFWRSLRHPVDWALKPWRDSGLIPQGGSSTGTTATPSAPQPEQNLDNPLGQFIAQTATADSAV
ncbi:MAG TPA: hypothetical protein VMQ76_00225, partial [Terracidiphilus sp.]|nr:hypothetical protein [Terracidiphilus sp.]